MEDSQKKSVGTETENLKQEIIPEGHECTNGPEGDDDIVQEYKDFDKMGLSKNLLHGIYSIGFEKPSSIQERAIVPLISGRDIIAQSQSGTGKTATFSIGVLSRIDEDNKCPQAIILGPTRELAKQIYDVISSLGQHTQITTRLLIGGTRRGRYDSEGDINEHILVGTPGRMCEYLRNRKINPLGIKVMILDEADEMLSRGFQDQIQRIFHDIPNESQIGLFSATMPNEMLDLTRRFMRNPITFLVHNDELTLEGIRQFYVYSTDETSKFEILCDLYSVISVTQSMIYVNSKKKAEWLTDYMQQNNFTVSCINGNMTQDERNVVMKDFRDGVTRVLITTDILSRGIDVQQVSLVLNYELPLEKETYIHRIGRSGRFGRKGVAINLVGPWEYNDLKKLETFYTTEINELPEKIDNLI